MSRDIDRVACGAAIAYTVVDSLAMMGGILMAVRLHRTAKAMRKQAGKADRQLDTIRRIVREHHGPVDFRAWYSPEGEFLIATDGKRHEEIDDAFTIDRSCKEEDDDDDDSE